MPFDGSGNYTPAAAPNFPAVGGTVISSAYYNNVINDIATALSNTLTRDGQGKPSADQNWNGKSLTNVNNLGAVTATFSGAVTLQSTVAVTGGITASSTITATGAINANGGIAATTGNFSGGLTGTTLNLSGGLTGQAISGTTITANGNLNALATIYVGTALVQNIAADATTLYLRGGNIAFQDAAAVATRAYLNSSGNLGIGTISPLAGYRITTSGGGVACVTASGANFDVQPDAASGANGVSLTASFTAGGYGPFKFFTGGAQRMTLDASGNLGIGTASPAYILHLNQNGNTQAWISATNAGSNSAGIGLENQGQRNWQIWADRTNDALQFGNNTRATVNMAIISSGNVGIGTTTPQGRLDVAGSALSQYFGMNATGVASGVANGMYAPAGNTLGFVTGLTERVRIDSSGNVGIGTTSPGGVFEVRKDQAANTVSVIRNGNTGGSAVAAQTFATGTTNSVFNILLVDGNYRQFSNAAAITVAYDDSDTHNFRTNAGVNKLVLASNGNATLAGTLQAAGLTLTSALAVAQGGTGATTAANARTNLGAQQALTFTSNANGWAFGLTIGATTYYLQFMPIGALGANGSTTLTYPVALTSTVMCAQADKYVAGPINDGLNLGPGAPGLTTMTVQNGGTAMSGGYALVIGW